MLAIQIANKEGNRWAIFIAVRLQIKPWSDKNQKPNRHTELDLFLFQIAIG